MNKDTLYLERMRECLERIDDYTEGVGEDFMAS